MDNDGCRQADIQGYPNIDRDAVTRQFILLEEEDHVVGRRFQADTREILVFISDWSHEIIKENRDIRDSIQVGFGIKDRELRELDALLVKIEDRFSDA